MFMLKSTHDFLTTWQLEKFNKLDTKFKELEKQMADLKIENDVLKAALDKLKSDDDSLTQQNVNEVVHEPVAVDWVGLNVVSIEREVNEYGCKHTTLGHLLHDAKEVSE